MLRRRDAIVIGLGVLLMLRCALGPYRDLAGQPEALFLPPDLFAWLGGMPSVLVIASVQLVGLGAGFATVVTRRRRWLVVAWLSLLFLAGLRTSLGKILHNDLLLLLGAVPFVLADDGEDAFPVQAATIVVAGSYLFTGYQKLRQSGLEWVTGDTMRWILIAGARSGKALTPAVANFVAERAWLSTLSAAGILALELTFPVVIVWRRIRIVFVVAAMVLHVGTYFALGLDYWLYVAMVPLVLLDWPAMLARRRRPVPA